MCVCVCVCVLHACRHVRVRFILCSSKCLLQASGGKLEAHAQSLTRNGHSLMWRPRSMHVLFAFLEHTRTLALQRRVFQSYSGMQDSKVRCQLQLMRHKPLHAYKTLEWDVEFSRYNKHLPAYKTGTAGMPNSVVTTNPYRLRRLIHTHKGLKRTLVLVGQRKPRANKVWK